MAIFTDPIRKKEKAKSRLNASTVILMICILVAIQPENKSPVPFRMVENKTRIKMIKDRKFRRRAYDQVCPQAEDGITPKGWIQWLAAKG